MIWKIKRSSNDELRQKFVDMTIPQVQLLGMTLPDPELKWNEDRKHYDYGEINWTEFKNIIKGNGPCNKQRIEARIKAHEEGALGSRSCYCLCIKKSTTRKICGLIIWQIKKNIMLSVSCLELHWMVWI